MDFLCIDFVNSRWYITHKPFKDPLTDKDWLLKLAEKWNINRLPAPKEEELAKLIEMRELFAKLLAKVANGERLEKEDIGFINGYMSNVSYYRKLQAEGDTLRLYEVPEARNCTWFMAEVAASLSSLCSSDAVKKLKLCQNPQCGWFFIDESKSRNRKWCDDTCATLMKVRRFRQKHRENEQKGCCTTNK